MPRKIILIDDNEMLRDLIFMEITSRFPRVTVFPFAYPNEFLNLEMEDVDLVICDYSFGNFDCFSYWDKLGKYKIIILTGSTGYIEAPCPIFDKDCLDEIYKYINSLAKVIVG